MKLKLTYIQFTQISYLLQKLLMGDAMPTDMQGRLMHALLMGVYKKFYAKAIVKKARYTITLDDEQALAWHIFFSRVQMDNYPYEKNLVQTINNQIHRKYTHHESGTF